MSGSVPGKLPRHLQVTDFDVSLAPGGDGRLQPVVQGLRVFLTVEGLRALAEELALEADRRAPVGLTLQDVRLGPGGVFLALRIQKSILRGDLATRLVLTAPGGEMLRVEFADVAAPAWVPFDLLLDEAAKRGGSAVSRDTTSGRALLLDPAALLARFGIPGRFAPGRWDVATTVEGLTLTFSERPVDQ